MGDRACLSSSDSSFPFLALIRSPTPEEKTNADREEERFFISPPRKSYQCSGRLVSIPERKTAAFGFCLWTGETQF